MVLARRDYETLSDLDLTGLMAARDPAAVRLITQRNNQRLFRTAWSILKNRAEAEDAVQSAYLHACAAIGDFEGRSSLSTWLTRIVVNEALGRARAARRPIHANNPSTSGNDGRPSDRRSRSPRTPRD